MMPNLRPSLTFYHDEFSIGSRAILLLIRFLATDDIDIKINVLNGNRTSEVPILIDHLHNDFRLWDCRTIASYLIETRFNEFNSLYPSDDFIKKARINQRLYFDANTLVPRMQEIVKELNQGTIAQVPRILTERLKEGFSYLNNFLETNRYVAANDITIADFFLISTVTSAIQIGARIDEYHYVQQWWQNLKETLVGFGEMETGAEKWACGVTNQINNGFT